ncbi:MAG: DUF4097 family beta strand repeat-containing protein [Lachnospiraceae bacterium]
MLCELPEETAFHFKADTNSGYIKAYFDELLHYNKKGSQAEGTVGTAEYQINIKTSSGDIKFQRR